MHCTNILHKRGNIKTKKDKTKQNKIAHKHQVIGNEWKYESSKRT